jgi:hypothetical protein
MREFPNGVRYYTKATLEIGFPERDICCQWCPLMRVEMASSRNYCGKTGEYLPVPKATVGYHCPLIFEINEEE